MAGSQQALIILLLAPTYNSISFPFEFNFALCLIVSTGIALFIQPLIRFAANLRS